jgi:hypothetical protein
VCRHARACAPSLRVGVHEACSPNIVGQGNYLWDSGDVTGQEVRGLCVQVPLGHLVAW